VDAGPRQEFAKRLAGLVRASGLQLEQAAARTMARRPRGARWSVGFRQISAWQNGDHLPGDDAAFLMLVRVLTEHARRRTAHGRDVGRLLTEKSWAGLLARAREQQRAPVSAHRTESAAERILVGAIPQEADCFQIRETTLELGGAFADVGTAVLCQVLTGMGGVGKTQLAAAHARSRWRSGAVDVLVWATATSRESIVASYAEAAARLGLVTDNGPAEQAAQRFLAWAESETRPWLLVLDDIYRPGDLHGLWPSTGTSGQVVATTRRRDSALFGARRRRVNVGLFTPPEARGYIAAKLAAQGHRDEAERIDALAGALGRLPLALAQAAAYMVDAGLDCDAYLSRFDDRRRTLPDVVPEPGSLPDDHRGIIAASWSLSIDQADRCRPLGLARPMLGLSSLLDPNGIPASALCSRSALAYLASHGSMAEAGPITPDDARDTLRTLHRYSLIDHDTDAALREVRVHGLIQRATRETLTARRRAAAAGAAADALLAIWPGQEKDGIGQVLRANAAHLKRRAGDDLWHPGGGAHPVLFRALTSLGEAGQVNAASAEAESLRDAVERTLGPDHPDALSARHASARWRGESGDTSGAATALEALLADRLRLLGPDHPDILYTRHNIAFWRGESGDAASAAAAFVEILADRLRLFGPDHLDTLTARSNVARWRGEMGDTERAAAGLEEALPDFVRVLGPDHSDTLTVRHNIAYWRGRSGDAASAAALLEGLLGDYLRVLGPDHPDTLTVRSNLARWRGETGDAEGAVTALEQVLSDRLRILGPDHPRTLTARGNLARWKAETGDVQTALRELGAVLSDRLRILGPEHPDTLATREDLARWREQERAGSEGAP
jgi:hypothetical protein